MKLQHKASLSIFATGTVFFIIVSLIYYYKSSSFAITNTQISSQAIVGQFVHHVEEQLTRDAQIAYTLANAPLITKSLTLSNSNFASLTEKKRKQEITRLNKQWMNTKDVQSPFIQTYMDNPIASYLRKQQDMYPDFFGEIFLTNRYGVAIATTRKLTTLAHAHKYWWVGSYYEGKGRIFFDDRGYDESVQGYVLGITIPVKQGDEIIGILKCNVKILESYGDIFNDYTENKPGIMRLVRSKGRIVFEKGVEPLSENVTNPLLVEKMISWSANSLVTSTAGIKQILSYAPVSITKGSDQYGFGGSYKSIDHIKGNLGEGWFVVFSQDIQATIAASLRLTQELLITGFILILFMAISALFFGKKIAWPIAQLANMTENIGKGDFKSEIKITSKDEIGTLAMSFNKMITNLRKTTISRDLLLKEIDQRKQVEKSLIESESRFITMFEQAPLGVALIDSFTGAIYEANPRYVEITGRTKEEITHLDWMSITHPDDVQEDIDNMALLNAGKIDEFQMNKRYKLPNGDYTWVKMTIAPLKESDQNHKRHLCMIDDINQQINAQLEKQNLINRLNQSQKMEAIGTLAGGIAHDFNNILSVIIGYTEIAKDDCSLESTIINDLDIVLDAGYRAKTLVQQILAFSRQEQTQFVKFKPAEIVKEAIKMLRPTLPATITINQDIDYTTGLVFAVPSQLSQTLMNLCTNAFHAMEKTGGTLDVSLHSIHLEKNDFIHEENCNSGNYVKLSVSDSGHGMPKEVKEKLFDPYFTTKEQGKGTGMGLSIIHGIVKKSGGFISFKSEIDKGTTFNVFLPIVEQDILFETENVEPIHTGKERILFIDDDEMLAKMGKEILERLGYSVTFKTSSSAALEIFQNHPDDFDLVITDQTMPGITGGDLSEKMLQIRPDIPIILCTGYSTTISEEKAQAIGIKEFTFKPIDKNDIAKLIRKVLDS